MLQAAPIGWSTSYQLFQNLAWAYVFCVRLVTQSLKVYHWLTQVFVHFCSYSSYEYRQSIHISKFSRLQNYCYYQISPKFKVLVKHTINMFGCKMECIPVPVVQGHDLRSMAQWIQQSIRKSWQKIWLPLLGSWDLVVGRLYSWTMTPNIHQNPHSKKPCSAMAISVSKPTSHDKPVVWTEEGAKISMILKCSAWRNDQKSLQMCSLILSQIIRKRLIAVIFARRVCRKY